LLVVEYHLTSPLFDNDILRKLRRKLGLLLGSIICGAGVLASTGFAAAAMIEARELAIRDQIATTTYERGPTSVRAIWCSYWPG